MPNIGPAELIIILVIALLVIGPGRLPDVGAALGKSIREFRKASSDMAEATRIDTAPLPPPAAPAPTPQPPAPVPNVLSNPAPVSPAPPAPDPVAAPPTTPSDGSTGQTS
jgi:sec-independent protein translocase protein TatA